MIYFITGTQEKELELQKIVAQIKSKNIDIELKYYDASTGEEEKFLANIANYSIFGGKELLILKRAENIKKIEKLVADLSEFNLSDKEIIIDCLDEKGTIKKKIEAIDKVKVIEAKKQNREELIKEMIVKELGIDDASALEMADIIGDDVIKAQQEIEKVKNFLGGEEFNINSVKRILSKSESFNFYEMTESLLNGNKREVMHFLKHEGNYMGFLYKTAKDLQQYLKLVLLNKSGKLKNTRVDYNTFSKTIYPTWKEYFTDNVYVVYKKLKRVEKLDSEFLKGKLEEVLKAELRVKSGEYDEDMAVELFVLNF